ncbi:hypothetical protein C7212DRAFT_289818 [Tuber magnatum]|uniref:CHY-type domain-containing protein n=1 Tax=Tuber magnatum TaxID=42249 RepID=A0A317T235_9PEZI|nr:hypothetical protein C7212DRAFT_289818 [Tuber magnatum]
MASIPGPAPMAENTKPKRTGNRKPKDKPTMYSWGEEGSSAPPTNVSHDGVGGRGRGCRGRRGGNSRRSGRGSSNTSNGGGKNQSSNQDQGIEESSSSQSDAGVQISHPRHFINVDPSKVVKRPIPRGRSEFISQVLRRFGCRGQVADTEITVSMSPSDPDFPYDIKQLVFKLSVPKSYPESLDALPSIKVINEDIPMGFRANIERGFDGLAVRRKDATLLDLLNSLDRSLEGFLAAEKIETLKIVPNTSQSTLWQPTRAQTPHTTVQPPKPSVSLTAFPVDSSTPEEASTARARRQRETHRLEARMRESGIFRKSEDGTRYTIPIEPRKKYELPVPLQNVTSVVLIVPLSYDIHRPWLEFPGVPEDVVRRVNNGFAKQIQKNPKFSLMENINTLCSNLHIMATQEEPSENPLEERVEETVQSPDNLVGPTTPTVPGEEKPTGLVPDKDHVQVIPHPPDWNIPEDGGSDDNVDSEYDSDDYVSDDPEPNHGEGTSDRVDRKAIERGTAMSLPGIDMPGVQLLEIAQLNVIVKCSKCKKELEVNDLKPTMPGKGSKPKLSQCEKCSQVLGIGFRQEFVHANSNRLGFFDLAGCVIVEILPSNFIPQCTSCSTSLPPPGIKGLVPGQRQSTNCRECHAKLSILIPEIKLLRITFEDDVSTELASQVPYKKSTERERYSIGHELPFQGRCAHYKKSTRWFRFSCCNKVFPCDKCHDEQVEPFHHWEHANRMICGTCSCEQQYRPEECRYCKHAFIKRYTGYWEGGTGTRDKRLLRRNDPRKHKRVNKPVL